MEISMCQTIHRFLVGLALAGAFAWGFSDADAAETPKESAPPQPFIIGVSPYLYKSVKDDVYRSIVRLLVEDLPLNSTLAIYDACELKTITHVSLPNARV